MDAYMWWYVKVWTLKHRPRDACWCSKSKAKDSSNPVEDKVSPPSLRVLHHCFIPISADYRDRKDSVLSIVKGILNRLTKRIPNSGLYKSRIITDLSTSGTLLWTKLTMVTPGSGSSNVILTCTHNHCYYPVSFNWKINSTAEHHTTPPSLYVNKHINPH